MLLYYERHLQETKVSIFALDSLLINTDVISVVEVHFCKLVWEIAFAQHHEVALLQTIS